MTETTLHKPYVLMISEITADGKLTLKKGTSSKVLMQYMSQEANIMLHQTRADYDAIMVGSSTIKIDNSFLTVRLVPGKSPLRVIPCSMADLPIDSNVLNTESVPTVVAVSRNATIDKLQALKDKGVNVVVAGDDKVDLRVLMDILYSKFSVRKLIIEGGPTLNWHMLHYGLVDEIRLIHLPFIVGGSDTPSLVGGMHIDTEDQMIKLELKNTKMVGTNLVTEYKVLKQ
ncbi:MAG TPA: dihydrofolate reductase family protein [Methanocorpusculum sp.]|nr:dihydrofolate reductase family protein [Methanocorpusculum sp.]